MKRRTFLGAIGGLGVLSVGGYVGYETFAPEQATQENEDRTGGGGAGGGGSDADTTTSDDTGTDSMDDTTGDDTGDDGTGGSGDVTIHKTGEFTGKAGHTCKGTVELAEGDAGFFLQFRDYEQTQGPDVYCYITPDPDPDTKAQIEAGTRVLIDGGADGGELTKTGTFSQSLPAEITDPTAMQGVASWCDDFSTPFGAATLESA